MSGRWRPADPASYAYLLGIYLGDGYVLHKPPGSWTLRVSCDPGYPTIERLIESAMRSLFPGAAPRRHSPASANVDVLSVSGAAIPLASPQHGQGHKHGRVIQLAPWQAAITHGHPHQLICGLIHSDGCRCVNRFRTTLPSGRTAEYAYPKYFFTNISRDIQAIFREHCDRLDVRVTQSSSRNLAISDRRSVAILDLICGPKS